MGTEVQYKMYLPQYYSVRDLNESTSNANCPPLHESRPFGQFYGMFSTRAASDGYVGYEKEQLRQTILRHETIFQHQLHELHRLYKIQMDMMNEVRSKEPHKHFKPTGTSQSNFFAFPSEDDKKRCYSNLPTVDFNHHTPFMLAAGSIQSHFSPMNIMQSGSVSPHIESRFKDHESLESKSKKVQKRLFDLELPAYEYINDDEKAQGAESYPPNKTCDVTLEKTHNLSTYSGANSGCNGDALSSNMSFKRSQGFADLNEPIQVEEASGTASVDIIGNVEEIQRRDLSGNSCSSFQCLAKEASQSPYKDRNGGVSLYNPQLENDSKQKGWLPYNAGQNITNNSYNGGLHHGYSLGPCESLKVGCMNAHLDQNKTEQQRKKTLFGVEISEKNQDSAVMASNAILLQPHAPQSNLVNSQSSSISSWKNPISVRSLGFERSFENGLWHVSHLESKESQVCGASVGFGYPNGISDSNSASEQVPECIATGPHWLMNSKSTGVNLNMVPQSSCLNEASFDSNLVGDGSVKLENPQGELSWLKAASLNKGKLSQNQFVAKAETMKAPSQSFIHDSSSATNAHDAKDRRIESGDSSSKILGVPIFDKYLAKDKPSASSTSNDAVSFKVGLLNTDLNQDPISSESGERKNIGSVVVEKGPVNSSANLKSHIDLNLSVTEEESQMTNCSPQTKVRIAVEIDLEAPAIVETDISVTSGGKVQESKLQEPCDSSNDESMDFQEGFVKVAAEALVAIASSGLHNFEDNSTCDSLQWFAEIVSSDKCNDDIITIEDSTPDMSDFFEYMTLNLVDTEVKEYHYKCPVFDKMKEEVTFQKCPRRGQARRGRQRKDFQRDILPGLASLSKNDVTEDLQMIEGLVRATGGTWQSSLSLKNSMKGKRGRKRAAASASSPPANPESPPQAQEPKCAEVGLEETRLTGWGKRTRRPPRQRCPINNSPPLAVQ